MKTLKRYVVLLVWVLVAVSCRPSSPEVGSDSVAVDPPGTTAEAPSPTGVPAVTATVEEPTSVDETTPAPPRNQLGPGDHTISLSHDRRDRSYLVHVPPTFEGPAPVVVALHGGGGTGAQFKEQNGLDAVADREGFVVVYPEGSGFLPDRLHTWNSGDNCCGFSLDRDIDDVGFLKAVLTSLATEISIDPARVYMTGHSNGGMMAYRFAAEHADLVTAIVSVAGAMDLASFNPSEPVAVLHVHSVDDPRALYDGGEGPPFPGTERTVFHTGVFPEIERWAAANGCEVDPGTETFAEGADDNAGHTADLLVWGGCAPGGDVEHLRLTVTGHGWPGVTVGRFWQERLGPPTTLIDASEVVWAFASRFERE